MTPERLKEYQITFERLETVKSDAIKTFFPNQLDTNQRILLKAFVNERIMK